MEKIIFNKRVIQQLNEIVSILFKEEYFSYVENAIEYRDNLLGAITVSNLKKGKISPAKNAKLGSFYINHRTTWYVFYDVVNNDFYIEHIINNHLPEAKFLNLS